jgi:hypothetical protein
VENLFGAPAEDERVAAFQAYDEPAGVRVLDEQLVDPVLGEGPALRDLRGVDDLHVGTELVEQLDRGEPVGDDHVGLGEQVAAAYGDQPGIAGAAADEGDAPRLGPGVPGFELATLQPADDGVADAGRPARVAARVHADGDLADPGAGRGPCRGGLRVVGAYAPDPLVLGRGGDGRVDLAVLGAGLDQPGAGEVAGPVGTAFPRDPAAGGEVVEGGRHLGRDHGHLRTGRQQGRHPALGHAPAPDDDDAPAGQVEAKQVRGHGGFLSGDWDRSVRSRSFRTKCTLRWSCSA